MIEQKAMDEVLAETLKRAFLATSATIDSLADSTKIPASTIRLLIGEPVQAVLPSRVYLRGQVQVIAKELKLDPVAIVAMFDATYPAPVVPTTDAERRLPIATVALAAGLGGLAILAVVLAFSSALG